MVDVGFLAKAMEATGLETFVVDEDGATQVAAPSPFINGTNVQFAWDSTSLGWLKTCPRLYYYNMIEGWRPNEENDHLRFGIEYHTALEDYDISRGAGIPHEDAVHDIVKALIARIADWHPRHKFKTRYNLVRTVVWYLDHYQRDSVETYIRKDGTPAVEVSFRFEFPDFKIEGQEVLLCGHLDRIVKFSDDPWVKDTKTGTSTPGEYYFKQYDVHNQMTLYTLAGQVVLNSPIRGVIIDYAQVADKFSRFTRGWTVRTPDQLEEWVHDTRYWIQQSVTFAESGYWPMNDMSCDKYGGCRFREICGRSPHVRERFLESNYKRSERWNPLKVR